MIIGFVLMEKEKMSKAKRKPRPSMPYWWWMYEQCALCKEKNNCNQCKIARSSAKAGASLRLKDKRQMLRGGEYE